MSATVEFVQSDMGLKEIITLVQALYKSVPEEIKQQVADVLPSLPSLPSNGFTDLLNDVTCSYDLDNMMANVTLLDLKVADNNDESSVAWDTSLKLQLFIMAGLYSKDGFVEKKDEDVKTAQDDPPERIEDYGYMKNNPAAGTSPGTGSNNANSGNNRSGNANNAGTQNGGINYNNNNANNNYNNNAAGYGYNSANGGNNNNYNAGNGNGGYDVNAGTPASGGYTYDPNAAYGNGYGADNGYGYGFNYQP